MNIISRGYKQFWGFALILLGGFMLFTVFSKLMSMTPDMRLAIADPMVYLLAGIGFIVLGIFMLKLIKKGKL